MHLWQLYQPIILINITNTYVVYLYKYHVYTSNISHAQIQMNEINKHMDISNLMRRLDLFEYVHILEFITTTVSQMYTLWTQPSYNKELKQNIWTENNNTNSMQMNIYNESSALQKWHVYLTIAANETNGMMSVCLAYIVVCLTKHSILTRNISHEICWISLFMNGNL